MFARKVSCLLKNNMLSECGHVFESQILPLLHKHTRALGTKSRLPSPAG
jgi:hypothetical protein